MIEFYCKDCLAALKEYPDKAFNLAIVDPPYGAGAQNGGVLGLGLESGLIDINKTVKRGSGMVKNFIIKAKNPTAKTVKTRYLGTLHRLKSILPSCLG